MTLPVSVDSVLLLLFYKHDIKILYTRKMLTDALRYPKKTKKAKVFLLMLRIFECKWAHIAGKARGAYESWGTGRGCFSSVRGLLQRQVKLVI